jgi:hypothetical protein
MGTTNLPLTLWSFALYLIGHAKNGISSLDSNCHSGVTCNTAWLVHSKIMKSMSGREDAYVLKGRIQLDDAYLG